MDTITAINLMKLKLISFLISALVTFSLFSQQKPKVLLAPLETKPYIKDSLHWKIKELDTGRDSVYLAEIEKDVILEMNMVRSNPKKYAELYLKPILSKFDGNVYRDTDYNIQTVEGIAAVNECINILNKERTLDLLYPNRRLLKMAKYHAVLQGVTEEIGHNTPKGETFHLRLKRFKIPYYLAGENIDYGNNSAREIIIALLVDDNYPSRAHRNNILNNFFNWVGVYFGSHNKYKYMIVTDFISYRMGF
jgi:hypothetical protein